MHSFRVAVLLSLGCCLAAPAQAETLRLSGVYPAASDDAVPVEAIAVDRFAGPDGPRLSFLVEDRLRQVSIGGQPWFTVLVPQLADEADALLQGYVEPGFVESRFRSTRSVCAEEDEDGECIEHRDVETDCLRVTASLSPEMRLVAYDGRLLWSSDARRNTTVSYCPQFDDKPDFSGTIDGWLEQIADQTRASLAPRYRVQDIRIMESRRGLERDVRNAFRDAIRMTEEDEREACNMFEMLFAANPQHPSLMFNAGLCAEQGGAFDLAEARYRQALGNDRSDDEAQQGLHRIGERRRAQRQLADRAALRAPDD